MSLRAKPDAVVLNGLPAFASPYGTDVELVDFLEQVSAHLCRWLSTAANRHPLPSLGCLPDIAPERFGRNARQLLEDLDQIMDRAYQPNHPGALAHLDPPPLTASIAADLVCAGLNNNLLAEELSPSLSLLERRLCRWFAERLGLPQGASGVAASGGTLSNLMALVAARHAAGLQHDPNACIVASRDAHVSLQKAVKVMGLREDALQLVGTDDQGCLDLVQLDWLLQHLHQQERPVLAVVATAGTTVSGSVDPIPKMRALCDRDGLWLHVDGAIGACFALNPNTSTLVPGLKEADSVTVNPQKLFGITKTSSLLLLANPSHLKTVFGTGLPYMETSRDGEHGGEIGLQGTRAAEILKLWLGLRQLGEEGIQHVLQSALERASLFRHYLNDEKFMLRSGPLHIVSFRPCGLLSDQLVTWTADTRQKLLRQGIMLSRPFYQDQYYLKAVFGNPHTDERLIIQLAQQLLASI